MIKVRIIRCIDGSPRMGRSEELDGLIFTTYGDWKGNILTITFPKGIKVNDGDELIIEMSSDDLHEGRF